MKKIFIDASTHPQKKMSAGALILQTDGDKSISTYELTSTNNHEAEFEILIHALELIHNSHDQDDLTFIYSDSNIVVDAFNKQFVKKEEFKPYLAKIMTLTRDIPPLFIEWIPESHNKMADHYAKQALHKYLKKMKR